MADVTLGKNVLRADDAGSLSGGRTFTTTFSTDFVLNAVYITRDNAGSTINLDIRLLSIEGHMHHLLDTTMPKNSTVLYQGVGGLCLDDGDEIEIVLGSSTGNVEILVVGYQE